MKTLLTVTTFILLFSSEAQCYLLKYGPFPDEKAYQPCSMNSPSFKEINKSGSIEWEKEYLVQDGAEKTKIQILAHTDKGIFASITSLNRHNIKTEPFNVGLFPFTFEKLFEAHLNQDSKKDFIFLSWTGGNGIAASTAYVTFALSSEQGYKSIQTITFQPDKTDFIKANDECKFIQTSLVYGEEGRDGKEHNYWVYNLYGFKGQNITPQNNLITNFPKWIMYSSKPNHTSTTQLTSEQKQRLWEIEEKELFVIPENYQDNTN